MTRTILTAIALVALSHPAAAHDVTIPASVVAGGDTTIVYVFPTSPQTFVPIEGLPSFLAMPGAQVPAIATQVVYATPGPMAPATRVTSLDVSCSNFGGEVTLAGPDRFDLDKDGDGIGCEAEDR